MCNLNIHSHCTFDEVPCQPYPFVMSLTHASHLHLFQATTTIKCHDTPNDTLITSTFVLPHTCQPTTSSITIPATRVLFLTSRLSVPLITPFNLMLPTFKITLPSSSLRLHPPIDDRPLLFLISYHYTFGYHIYITLLGILIAILFLHLS